ncbi:FKBP-type peptidyl-prolyl cis-trans isomerase [Roseiconus nitratireducens]|uniref:Peptidyl-prolyl cis-trans isomerase n=2 Tax=Roseiconus nitratireducens TaxID=2605748 RepID=A0A5M6D903_9BACT|nr:FKBP-type peptidyl-prolyl cis-trans isomerase [Roseiconus nitratireducens]
MTYAQENSEPQKPGDDIAQENPIGYFLGVSMGQQLLQQGLKAEDFDTAAMAAGVADALKRNKLALSNEQLQAAQVQLQKMLTGRHEEMAAEIQKKAKENKEKGALWLEQNKKKEGVKELAGGLQYKELKSGDGPKPSQSDTVRVHYTGRLINGDVFDSSVERGEPTEFVVGQVIKGWQMALQEMNVGDKWMLFIPPELAYGDRGSPGAIGPNEVLVFEVELLDII